MSTISKNITILTLFLYITALFTVVATAHFDGYETLLKTMSKENGFFENISVIVLFIIFFYGIYSSWKNRKSLRPIVIILILLFSLVAFVAGMEEISWGQQIFHFQSSEFFLKENLQKETNLHNLIDANLFSSIIYISIYSFFIFIPLFYKIFRTSLEKIKLLHYFDINPHIILVTIFSSIFQIYFYNDIGVWTDMFSLFSALTLFAYFLWREPSDRYLNLHFAFILLATLLSLWSYEVYMFKNMQYEIREAFVVLSALFIFMELVEKEKNYS